jgi:aryl-alcohol dehydrogenase-like predicted oxidoreductase
VLRRAVELGVNFIDTADVYGPEVSERLIAEALRPYPTGLVIGTKGGLVRLSASHYEHDGRPKSLRRACEGSLQRLGLEAIDLYQLHRPDPKLPFEESLGALMDMRDEGKIRMIGLSNVSESQLATAVATTKIVSVQNRYNVGDRESDSVIELCENHRIAFLPWSPLAKGRLAGADSPSRAGDSDETEGTPGQMAIAWLLARSPVMLPIPGTSSVAHLEENVGAGAIELPRQDNGLIPSWLRNRPRNR